MLGGLRALHRLPQRARGEHAYEMAAVFGRAECVALGSDLKRSDAFGFANCGVVKTLSLEQLRNLDAKKRDRSRGTYGKPHARATFASRFQANLCRDPHEGKIDRVARAVLDICGAGARRRWRHDDLD